MESTIIGVYDDYSQAQKAMNELLGKGLSRSDIELSPSSDSPEARQSALRMDDQSDNQSSGSGIGNFFRNLFGGGDDSDRDTHGDIYSEAVRRGSYLLSVQSQNDEQHQEIINVMDRFDPVDIDERAAHWRSQGWSQYDSSASALSDDEIQRERSSYASQQAAPMPAASSGAKGKKGTASKEQTRIPVVEEELQVGKREVQRGGVRIFKRVSEMPVNESVQLREEHVNVERRPVNQPATQADTDAFKEGSIELRESAEEAVVSKNARVVEEVVVGKEVTERTENISDTVRRTDVEVEQLGAQNSSGRSGMTDRDSEFRNHWQSTYGTQGGRYEDHAPAYQYGSRLAGDQRYSGRRWNDLEADARTDWESSHADHPWEKAKDAVRYGWERK